MPLSRKALKRTMIVFNPHEKNMYTGYATFASPKMKKKNLEEELTDIEVDEIIELQYSLDDIENKLKEAIGSGRKVSVRYFNTESFDRTTGYVERFDDKSRKVTIVYYGIRWEIMVCNIIDIEEE